MKLIDLHYDGELMSINIEHITSLSTSTTFGTCKITCCGNDHYIVDEKYDEVKALIRLEMRK